MIFPDVLLDEVEYVHDVMVEVAENVHDVMMEVVDYDDDDVARDHDGDAEAIEIVTGNDAFVFVEMMMTDYK
jgi:hypothetical protein